MPESSSFHIYFMQKAIALGEYARLHAPPNPWVGCVIVKDGKIIGQGYTSPPGQAHAEIWALQQAQGHAKGATLYTTLEPCAHIGRTPSCTSALIRSGIQEVYFGVLDPDLRVRGKGMHQLRQAGIKVIQGICEKEIQSSLAPYLYQRQTGLPYTVLKAAVSIDGRIAAADQTSQWITCSQAREDAHLQRARSQAILIGAGTALKDSPRLTVRHLSDTLFQQPLRILLDAKGKVPAQGPLFDQKLAHTLVITTPLATQSRQNEWLTKGAEVITVAASPTGVDLEEAWSVIGERSILQVLVEGGTNLSSALLDTSLVNSLLIYMGPLLLGASGYPLYDRKIFSLQDAMQFFLREVQQIGQCVRLNYQKIY